jgi:prepilin-type N-terminal cleavage/methylation domain-containing protein
MNRHPASSGFSLVELLVSMLVFLLVLLVTNGLLVESLRIFSNSGRELREPGTELAIRLLREDLHASAPLAGRIGSEEDPMNYGLDCRRPDRTETWEMDGTRLVRRTYDADGVLLGTRPMLDGMVSFAWWTPAPGVVQIQLVRRKPAGASALRVATAAWKSVGDTLEAAHVVSGSRITWSPGE